MITKTGSSMKTALITGGTSGVGLSIVKELVQRDYRVLLIGSNNERGQKIALELNTKRPKSTQFILLDLSGIRSVHQFSEEFIKNHDRLDVLANIAGVLYPTRQETQEGLEKTFVISYLSAFLLSTKLVPLLENTPGSRIVNVGAAPSKMFNTRIDFDDLSFLKKYNGFKTSLAAVHAKTVLTEILSERYAPKGIDVNSFDPGMVRSNLMRNMPFFMRSMAKLFLPFMAKTSTSGIYVCSSQEIQGTTGMLYCKKKAYPLNFDSAYKEKLWKQSENLINIF
jgi:NAD(P)-dependent dehydrogenase (short-subunit alcohol dehydrogenase family)